MDVLRLIDTSNGNSIVGRVVIRLDSSNEWDDEILSTMISRYTNAYWIHIADCNE